MTNDQNNSTTDKSELAEEFSRLGENLKTLLQVGWQQEEVQKLNEDIRKGFQSVNGTLEGALDDLKSSPVVEMARKQGAEVAESIRQRELGNKVRNDLTGLLNKLNSELNKTADKWTPDDSAEPDATASESAAPQADAADESAE